MIILVDMDGVLVDIERGFIARCQIRRPDLAVFEPDTREHFDLTKPFPKHERRMVRDLIREPGFFAELPPVEGAIEAIKEIDASKRHAVYIVTSAGTNLPYAASEKYQWVERHLGNPFLNNLIITPAKFMVRGDVLIDDKPNIRGEQEAQWEHILYDRPYNRDVTGKRRLTWNNWQSVLL